MLYQKRANKIWETIKWDRLTVRFNNVIDPNSRISAMVQKMQIKYNLLWKHKPVRIRIRDAAISKTNIMLLFEWSYEKNNAKNRMATKTSATKFIYIPHFWFNGRVRFDVKMSLHQSIIGWSISLEMTQVNRLSDCPRAALLWGLFYMTM